MKVIRKILYFIAGLLVLLTILIVVCAYNPALTAKIQGIIFKGRSVDVSDKPEVEEGAVSDPEGEVNAEPAVQEEYRMRTLEELGISEESLI